MIWRKECCVKVNPSHRKANRILQIEALLLAHSEGLRPIEIAERLGVNRSTISRYLPDLPGHIYVEDDGRWRIDREAYLIHVRFTMHEALAIHLAARLLTNSVDRQNPHAAAALRKLGVAMERLAPQISRHVVESADRIDEQAQRNDPDYLNALQNLTIAWAEGRKVKLQHYKEGKDEPREYVFSPYYIEPNAIGRSTYVIGWREPPGALRTFKIERLGRVELLSERYQLPQDFSPQDLLASAWGIWYTEKEPVEVVLRFSPQVSRRLGETRWHRSEQVTPLEDGGLLWRALIAEPMEMVPWIRGWGSDCEVIRPESLRDELKRVAKQLYSIYLSEEDNPPD